MTLATLPADPTSLVASFSDPRARFAAYQALVALGEAALPAIRGGLAAEDWQVRKWSAICLDRISDEESLAALVPLLRDPKSDVRLWAVHSVACDHCKTDVECPVDVVPHLVERALTDESVRVRRMAVIMLGSEFADPRALPALERLAAADDRKLRLHAENALTRYREKGISG